MHLICVSSIIRHLRPETSICPSVTKTAKCPTHCGTNKELECNASCLPPTFVFIIVRLRSSSTEKSGFSIGWHQAVPFLGFVMTPRFADAASTSPPPAPATTRTTHQGHVSTSAVLIYPARPLRTKSMMVRKGDGDRVLLSMPDRFSSSLSSSLNERHWIKGEKLV